MKKEWTKSGVRGRGVLPVLMKCCAKVQWDLLAVVLGAGALILGFARTTDVHGALGRPSAAQGGGVASGYTFTTIDVQGAGTGMLQGTIGVSLNGAGDITGVYLTPPNVAHGFVRSAATGTITAFDAPNAGTSKNQGTFPIRIEAAGNITGMYADSNNAYHGFLRAPDGTVAEFDVTGAPTNIGHRGTVPLSINASLEISGFYVDANDVRHGFLRAANGTFTTLDVAGAGAGPTQGTIAGGLNGNGGIAGFYVDASAVFHGFTRNAKGVIDAPINDPNATTVAGKKGAAFGGTLAHSFNTLGDVAGIYTDANLVFHGFLIDPNGAFTNIDAPGAAAAGLFRGTILTNMDGATDITGTYSDPNGVNHGFVIPSATGTMNAPIDAPGAATSGMIAGTVPFSINGTGELTGAYIDTSGVFHGFLATAPAVPTPPTFSPIGGTYSTAQSVTISDGMAGTTIFYTLDGSPPTFASSVFSTPIPVTSDETIKAMAAAFGLSNSAVATATYIIGNPPPPAATPTFSPVGGTYTSVQNVTISDTTPGATIYYTTNGTTPTTASSVFTGPIVVKSTETIEAMAVASGFSNSSVASAMYTINLPPPDFQVSVNPASLTIVAGQSGTATFTVTPINGFNSAVTFACSGLPAESACNFSPASVTPNGTAVNSTLTVTTTAKTALVKMPRLIFFRPMYLFVLSVLAMLLIVAAWRRRRSYVLRLASVAILLITATTLVSCNGGNSSSGNPGTPVGTTSASVTASTSGAGAMNHSATLTITITQ